MCNSQNLPLRPVTGPVARYLWTRQFCGVIAALRCKLVDYSRKAASYELRAAGFLLKRRFTRLVACSSWLGAYLYGRKIASISAR